MAKIADATLVIAVSLSLAACASPPNAVDADAQPSGVNDPIEPANRTIFDANKFVDRNVAKPVAEAYRDNLPDGVRHAIHNSLSNLDEPVIGLNDALQGNFGRALVAVQRFAVNTTAGGVGVFDVASDWDLRHHDADFGQTLGVWGIGEGPYVELPFLGPSDARDAVGTLIGFVVNPFFLAGGSPAVSFAEAGISAGKMLDTRTNYLGTLDALESTSVDYYATLRSVYLQHRQALVAEGKSPEASYRGRVDVKFNGPDVPKLDNPDALSPNSTEQ